MKPDAYAHALFQLMEKGEKPKEVVTKLHTSLTNHGRVSLLPQIARAFKRLAEREIAREKTTLTVSRKEDEKLARDASGATDAELVVDENVIGGWRMEGREELVDATFKKHLLTIYNRATR